MNITEQGGIKSPVPGTQAVIDFLRGARRMSLSPLDYADQNGSLLGHYRISANTGAATGIAAAGIFASCRWSDNHAFMIPLLVKVSSVITTAGTALPYDCEMVLAHAFSVAHTGGTAVAPVGVGMNKNRSNMGNSLVADYRIATTAALAGGTATLDTNGVGNGIFDGGVAVVGAASKPVELYKYDVLGQHPLVLGQNEGWVLRFPHAMPTTAVATIFVTYEWAEVAAY